MQECQREVFEKGEERQCSTILNYIELFQLHSDSSDVSFLNEFLSYKFIIAGRCWSVDGERETASVSEAANKSRKFN